MNKLTKDEARKQRQQIATLLNQGLGIRAVARELNITPSTVQGVKARMEDPSRSVEEDARESNSRPEVFDEETMKIVLRLREKNNYGARMLWELIKRDPERYGLRPDLIPSVRTIATWLTEAGATGKHIGPKDNRGWPVEWSDSEPGIIALDGTGPYHWGSDRIYAITAKDYNTRLSLAIPTTSRMESASVNTWVHALVRARMHLLPNDPLTHVFTDNGEAGIANGHTKQIVRWALKMGAIMTFNAPAKPWKAGRLENWHYTIKREYVYPQYDEQRRMQAKGQRRISTKEWIQGLLTWTNDYNAHRPHSALKRKAPADTADYLPFGWDDIMEIPRYEELPPQKGIVDVLRLVWNTGEVELWGTDTCKLQDLFGGQYVRFRFECDPEADEQVGKVVWQRGRHKEPLVIATFNHKMDRTRKRGEPFMTNIRFVDFEDTITPPPTNFLQAKDWTNDRHDDNKHASSSVNSKQTRYSTIQSLLDYITSRLVPLYLNSNLSEAELKEMTDNLFEQVVYQAQGKR